MAHKDKDLIELCIANNNSALNEFYSKFAPKMFGVCLRYARNRDEAEDFLQEGFIKVFTNLHTFKFNGSLEGWVRRIIVNTAINFYRQKYPWFEDIETSKEAKSEVHVSDVVEEMSAKEILQLIQQLPEGYKMVFNLYVIEGYQHKEIAEMLGVSENTSKSQLLKARRALQEMLSKVSNEYSVSEYTID